MKIAGIIAEYNPFHNGHLFHLEKTREAGFSHIAVAMSGPFVQRGETAVLDKWTRARTAVSCGADLVLELPVACALSSAADFARGGVSLLRAAGAQTLSFGSECGDAGLLAGQARRLDAVESSAPMRAFLKEGMSFPRAREAAWKALYGEEPAFAAPNDLLAVEYLRAASALAPGMTFLAVGRAGCGHDGDAPSDGFASASFLRSQIDEPYRCAPYMPKGAFLAMSRLLLEDAAPARMEALERHTLHVLRGMEASGFARLPDVTEGLENRLVRAARQAGSLAEFYALAKTKRYPLARLRRIACCAVLGIGREEKRRPPAYLRVLALNGRGAQILSAAKKRGAPPIGVNFADLYRLRPEGLELDLRAQELFALAQPSVPPCGRDFTEQVKIQDCMG